MTIVGTGYDVTSVRGDPVPEVPTVDLVVPLVVMVLVAVLRVADAVDAADVLSSCASTLWRAAVRSCRLSADARGSSSVIHPAE